MSKINHWVLNTGENTLSNKNIGHVYKAFHNEDNQILGCQLYIPDVPTGQFLTPESFNASIESVKPRVKRISDKPFYPFI